MEDFIRALTILMNHTNDKKYENFGASHDEFQVYGTDTPLDVEEIAEMISLGWRQDGMDTDDIPGAIAMYNLEENWRTFF